MKRFRYLVGAGVLAAGVVLAACGGGGGGGAAQELTVTSETGFKFVPNSWTVKVNQPVKVTHVNKDQVVHDWVVDGIDGSVKVEAQPGRTVSKTFTPKKTGTFQVYCAQPGHKEAGMVGTLTVQP
jgi:uncharacterized cupredoxin-like copper-binding protein